MATRTVTKPETEIWRNDTDLTQYMVYRNARGDDAPRRVHRGESVEITPQEREYHSASVRGDQNDVFKSGALTPVRVGPDVPRTVDAITPDEVGDLFALPPDEFEARVAEVTSQQAIDRLLKEAKTRDVSVSRLGVVEHRRAEILADRLSGAGIEVVDGRRKLDLQEEDYAPPGQSTGPKPAQSSTRKRPPIAK